MRCRFEVSLSALFLCSEGSRLDSLHITLQMVLVRADIGQMEQQHPVWSPCFISGDGVRLPPMGLAASPAPVLACSLHVAKTLREGVSGTEPFLHKLQHPSNPWKELEGRLKEYHLISRRCWAAIIRARCISQPLVLCPGLCFSLWSCF